MAKVTIWINRENEQFWLALENKSGWVNAIIEMLIEEDKKRREMKDDVYVKYEKKLKKVKEKDEPGV